MAKSNKPEKKKKSWSEKTIDEISELSRDILMINSTLALLGLTLIGLIINAITKQWWNLLGLSMLIYLQWVTVQKFAFFDDFSKKSLKEKKEQMDKLIKKAKRFP